MAALIPQELSAYNASSNDRSTLSAIKDRLLKPSLTSHYICQFQVPNTGFITERIDTNATKLYDKVSLPCFEASLPGSSLMTNEINDDHTGVTERHAYRRQYDDRADFTFYVGAEDHYVIRLFEAWMSYAMNEQYGNFAAANNYHYRAEFPDNYSTGGPNGGALSITKFEKDFATSKTSLVYNFVRAFPISINSMPLSYDSSDLLKCTVSLSYSRYWIEQLSRSNTPVTGTTSGSASTPTQNTGLNRQDLRTWARTNETMIQNVGTSRQREILEATKAGTPIREVQRIDL